MLMKWMYKHMFSQLISLMNYAYLISTTKNIFRREIVAHDLIS